MRRLSNGDVTYHNDFWFEEIFLFILVVLSPAVVLVELTRQPANYVVGIATLIASIACAYAFLTNRRRTYLFSPSASVMTWTSQGLFGHSGGEVGFKDIAITIDAGRSFSWFGRNSRFSWVGGWGSPIMYDIVLTAPARRAYLWRSFRGECEVAVREATELRGLLGQSADSLVSDSIAQMLRDGNRLGAKYLEREISKAERADRVSSRSPR